MREALTRGDWDAVGAAIAEEWENRKRLAPGVTTPAIDDLIARAAAAGAHGGESVRRRRRRLPVLLRPAGSDAPRSREALAAGGARLLDYRIERDGLARG